VVHGDRAAELWRQVNAATTASNETTSLCRVSAEITATSGAAIMVMTEGAPRASFCASGPVSELLDDLQFTLGEGPCIEAFERDRIVLEPDLASPAKPRWSAFTPRALDVGVRAVFGFPVRAGTITVGSLNLHRDVPGPLTAAEHDDAVTLADMAAVAVLASQGSEVDLHVRLVVHQASGMVSEQIGTTVADALARLRAHAYAEDRPLDDVAIDVVARRLRFEP
jgi:GAF domain-containing protein